MALAIALAVVIITFLSGYFFWAHTWWFPVDISTHGHAIDRQFMLTLIITGVIFVLAQCALAYALWRYRDRGDGQKAHYSHGNNKLELTWTTAAAIMFIGLNLMGYHIWAGIHFVGAQPGAMKIEVWGQQFAWYFRYPGPDGQFGPNHIGSKFDAATGKYIEDNKVNDATGNFLGLDREHDAASKDDIVTATLAIPVHQPVEITLRAKDVTHSFFVRELRLKQDLVPGMEIPIHFTATKTGRYEIACAELCGLGHYKMRAFMDVMTQEDYQNWLQKMAEAQ
jgi:cytochrome c oxidase subunit 2